MPVTTLWHGQRERNEGRRGSQMDLSEPHVLPRSSAEDQIHPICKLWNNADYTTHIILSCSLSDHQQTHFHVFVLNSRIARLLIFSLHHLLSVSVQSGRMSKILKNLNPKSLHSFSFIYVDWIKRNKCCVSFIFCKSCKLSLTWVCLDCSGTLHEIWVFFSGGFVVETLT